MPPKNSPRVIAVVTGSRAEFGLLEPVMRAIAAHPRLRLRTIVTGTHLTAGTWRDIPAAGLTIHARVPMQKRGQVGRQADALAVGRGVAGFSRAFARLKPDVVLVLGDRIEVLAAAVAASVGGYRLGHLHGGDRAEGVADEAIRHAVSKLAHLHFPATTQSRQRLIRMGEDPQQIFCVGSPAVDGLRNVQPAADAPAILLMQHPIGAPDDQEARWARQTWQAVADLGLPAAVFAPNADPGSEGIRRAWRALEKAGKLRMVEHLPRQRFLAMLAGARVIVGNSSAGLIEAAALRVACVNIGPRQAGRQRPGNVVDCPYGRAPVRQALQKALRLNLQRLRHPYGQGQTGEKIAKILSNIDLENISARKCNTY